MEEEARDSTFTVSIIHHRFFTFSSRFFSFLATIRPRGESRRIREASSCASLAKLLSLEIEEGKNPIGNVNSRYVAWKKKKKKKKKKERNSLRKLLVATFSRRFFSDGKTLRRSAGCTSCLSRSSRPGTSASFSSLYLCRNFPRKPRDTGG